MKHIFILLLLSSFFATGQSQTESLPKPSGKYFVGVTYFSFVDYNRKELFDNNQEKNREITVKAWYPSDIKSDFEPYLLNSESEFAVKYLQFPEIFRTMKTNSSRDVPLSSKEKKYPVLIFSHGWGEHYSQNSVLMEELASHGYIVFSISHHYECKFSSYPDGRFIYIDMNSQRLQKIMGEMTNPKALALIQKFTGASNDEERLQVFADMEKVLPTGLLESPKYWAEDISFFIDQLNGLNNENKFFKNKLNLNRLGVFGMSLGGLASIEVSMLDNRVRACVSMDGGFHGLITKSEIKIPAMFLNSKRYLGYGNIFTNRSTMDCYSLTVKNSDHFNFSDYSIYPVPAAKPLLGSIDGGKVIEIMNIMVLNFFDKYLKEKHNIDLIKKAELFSEIEIATNIK
jgi:predicted dienelactone hydrolase